SLAFAGFSSLASADLLTGTNHATTSRKSALDLFWVVTELNRTVTPPDCAAAVKAMKPKTTPATTLLALANRIRTKLQYLGLCAPRKNGPDSNVPIRYAGIRSKTIGLILAYR